MATTHAPSALVGSGMVFFNNTYVGHCTRCEIQYNVGEAVGRYKGHVVESSPSTRDVMVNLHMDDLRPENGRYWINKLANSYASLTVPDAAVSGTSVIEVLEPITLIGSTTAVTLSMAGATNVAIFKRDFSVQYATATDWTRASSQITRLTSGNIASGQEVLCAYSANDASSVYLPLGGGNGFLRGRLVVSMIEGSTGKPFQYIHEACSPVGDMSLVFEHAADWGGVDVSFRCFARLDQTNYYGKLVWGSAAVKGSGN